MGRRRIAIDDELNIAHGPLQRAYPIADGEPEVTVRQCRVALSETPCKNWIEDSFAARITRLERLNLKGFYNDEQRILEVYSPQLCRGLRLVDTDGDLPAWDSTAPFTNFLAWANDQEGAHLLHAAVIGTEDGAMLLSGVGGSGKSLATLSAVVNGMQTVGDDYVLASWDDTDGLFAFPCSILAKQSVDGLERLGPAAHHLMEGDVNWSQKRCFSIDALRSGAMAARLPISCVAQASLGPTPKITPVARRKLFDALFQSTQTQVPARGGELLHFLGRTLTRRPCFEMTLGPDLDRNTKMIQAHLGAM